MDHWPVGLTLLDDVSPADWVPAGQAPWPANGPTTVATFVPAVFEAYARVLPPARVQEPERVWRWSDISAITGVPVRATTRYQDLVARSEDAERAEGFGEPADGTLDHDVLVALTDVLAAHTSTPDVAHVCVWEGYGDPGTRALSGRPQRVRCEHRDHHLFRGPLTAVAPAFGDYPPATIWWPADRTWLVMTELDGFNTFLGAGRAAVDALVSDDRLEVVEATADTPLDPSWSRPAG